MRYDLLIAGILLLGLTVYDLLITAFSTWGAGPVTGRLNRGIWRFLLWTTRKNGHSKFLNYSGIINIAAVLLMWIVLAWVANVLMFSSQDLAVVHTSSTIAATLGERIYFTGYVLSSMGNGEFMAGTTGWKIYMAVASFTGFVIVTIAISYLVPVLSAYISSRKLAIFISTLGISSQEILTNSWNGKNFSLLEQHFPQLASSIIQSGQSNLTYPVLFYFHSNNKTFSESVSILLLDEALTILLIHVKEEHRPSNMAIYQLRSAITSYLNALEKGFIHASDKAPPRPEIAALKEAGIPLNSHQGEVSEAYEQLAPRRKSLLGFLESDGWHLDDLMSADNLKDSEPKHGHIQQHLARYQRQYPEN